KSGRGNLPDDLSYEQARDLLQHKDARSRTALAKRQDMQPEILYYLAGDRSKAVRRNVAANPSAPVQASELLANDQDDEVRRELARKIARLLPDLDRGETSRLYERTIKMLEKLAQDQVPRVRQIVAEEIKHFDDLPHSMIRALAFDAELMVCAPILEYSPLLNDDDLREIIATTTVQGALTAVSRRSVVSMPVSDAIAATLDIPAVAALLANPDAQIREDTLDRIMEHAETIEEWHEPAVMRPSLSVRTMRRISGFVASSMVQTMIERHNLDDEFGSELLQNVRKRIRQDPHSGDKRRNDADYARQLFDAGKLDEATINDAIDGNRRDFVIHATSRLARLSPALVTKILDARNGRVITSLAWKAGLGMRIALRLQRDLIRIPPTEIVNAKNGIDYPLSAEEMTRHLSLYGA
ncbi:MAG: DUF2336 domain-containing protein, partial [Sphingomonadales bacterium]